MKLTRRLLLGVAAFTLSGLDAGAIVRGGISTSGGGGGSLSTTMTLVNTSGSTQAANFVSPIFGMTFKKGDIASGTAPIFGGTVSTTVYPYSWGLQSYYNDGSLRHASFMFLCKDSIAGGGTLSVTVKSGGTAPSASSRTLTEVYAQSLQVGGTGIGSFGGLTGTWNGYLRNDTNNTEQYVYMDGQAGKAWRIKTHMAQSAGGAAHGQLEVYHYVTALQDSSGNLGGFRHVARICQPYYNNDTPTKALRAFSSISTQYGGGPTTIPLTWPFNNINFTGSNGNYVYTVASAGTHNLYSGAQAGSGSDSTNVVPGYLTSNTDGALATSQIYFAYTFGAATNNTQFWISKDNVGGGTLITSSGGTGTFVPIPIILHGVSLFTADSQGRANFFQGTGSMSADNTVRTQFNGTYLHSTGAIPPWDLSKSGTAFGGTIKDIQAIVGNPSAFWGASPTWNPVSCGPISLAARGGTGDNFDIGPLTTWHACHFYNQSAVADLAVRAMAFSSDFDGLGLRDVTTGQYPNVTNTTYTGMPAPSANQQSNLSVPSGGYTAPSTPPQGNVGFLWGGEQTCQHKASTAFYAFLVFGEPHFYDLMIEAGVGGIYEMNPTLHVTSAPAPVMYANMMAQSSTNLRGKAWMLRDIMLAGHFAAATSPDGSAVPQYVSDLATNNVAWCNDLYSSTYLGSALNAENSWRSISINNSNSDPNCGGFQMGYFLTTMAWNAALGDSGSLSWLNTYATWLNYVCNTYGGYHLYAEYDGAVQMLGGFSTGGPIPSLSQYGIATAVYTTLSWAPGSPAFTAPPAFGFGWVATAGDRWVFGPDQSSVPQTTGAVNLSYNTGYYAVNVSGNNFDLATTPGGAAIPITNSGSMSQGGGSDAGYSYPWILLAAPPAASTGFTPSAAGFSDSYVSIRRMGCDWATAAGATGFATARTDAVTREAANPPDNTGQANWTSQNTL